MPVVNSVEVHITRLKAALQHVQVPPVQSNQPHKVFHSKDLDSCTHVFVKHNALPTQTRWTILSYHSNREACTSKAGLTQCRSIASCQPFWTPPWTLFPCPMFILEILLHFHLWLPPSPPYLLPPLVLDVTYICWPYHLNLIVSLEGEYCSGS